MADVHHFIKISWYQTELNEEVTVMWYIITSVKVANKSSEFKTLTRFPTWIIFLLIIQCRSTKLPLFLCLLIPRSTLRFHFWSYMLLVRHLRTCLTFFINLSINFQSPKQLKTSRMHIVTKSMLCIQYKSIDMNENTINNMLKRP